MDDRDYAVNDLKSELSRVTENNRNKIQLITLMADDYSNYADGVVMAICDFIRQLAGNKKLVGIYIMDSILKYQSDSTEEYRRLFGREIVDLFVDTFQKAPIEQRHSLHKVRVTWQPILPKSKLYQLDMRIQAIDRVWPIMKDSVAATPAAAPAPAPAPAPLKSKPAVDPRKENKPIETAPKPSAPVARAVAKAPVVPKPALRKPTVESSASIIPAKKAVSTTNANSVTKSVSATSATSTTSIKSNGVTPMVQVKMNGTAKDPRLARRQAQALASSTAATVAPPPPKPEPVRPATVKPVVPPPIIPVPSSVSTSTESIVASRPAKAGSIDSADEPMDLSEHGRKTHRAGRKKRPKHPDTIVEHEPARPNRPLHDDKKRRRVEEPQHVQPTAAPGAHAFLPPPPPSMNVPPPTMNLPPPMATPPLNPSPPLKVDVDETWRSAPPPSVQPPPPPMIMPSNIINETPKIGVSSNNRIFVEGRAYEVHYINNEAVIEQNGLPHRISFTGPPRDILIDGHPVKMSFDETRNVNIDGVLHPIRFGAPSRELFVGEHPFRGAFNGPPMIANINGKKHEFRLCGPPPEVRIDKDPCYELSRYMNSVRAPQPVKPPQEEQLNVRALLAKIKESGLINSIKSTMNTVNNFTRPAAMPPTLAKPSPPARVEVGGTSRENLAPSSIKDFNLNVLSVRYSQVIDALHAPRTSCHHCGISFPDQTSQSFQRHIDMHVQDLLRNKEAGKSRSRQWFMPLDTWLTFDELAEVQKDPAQDAAKNAEDGVDPDASNGGASPSDVIATSSLNKNCTVCHEKFVEYYDNDEDEWRFQDGIVSNGLAVHRSCLEQMGGTALSAVKQEALEAVPAM